MALRVFGIVNHEAHGTPRLPELKTYALRDLAAVYDEAEYTLQDLGTADTQHHLDVVTALFAHDAVLPTPVGTVFRNTEVLERWMDIHYVALSDALAWVEDRLAARVHINRADGKAGDKEAGSDLAAVAAEVTRSLRRHAVSTVPLRNEEVTGIVLSAAYLVERQLWKEFVSAVDEEREKHTHISVEVTGPWPPYDFVRLQFGA
jgi:hypothetical protein